MRQTMSTHAAPRIYGLMAEFASALSERLPHATFKVLAGVGHVPMIDDPGLVARTILAVTGAAKA